MALHGIKRFDLEGFAIEKIIIVRVSAYPGGELPGQRSDGLGDSNLRLERPTVGTDIQKLIGIVLSQRRRDLKARADNNVRLIVAKVFKRERRRAVKQHRESQLRIVESKTFRLRSWPASLALPSAHVYGRIMSNFPDLPHKSKVRTYASTAVLSLTSVSVSGTDGSVPTVPWEYT